jgi:hypothetical protein
MWWMRKDASMFHDTQEMWIVFGTTCCVTLLFILFANWVDNSNYLKEAKEKLKEEPRQMKPMDYHVRYMQSVRNENKEHLSIVNMIRGAFDLHITVNPEDVYRFRLFCEEYHVDMAYAVGFGGQQLMTSQHTKAAGTNGLTALRELFALEKLLISRNIRPIRSKLEARAQSDGVQEFLKTPLFKHHPERYYFEFHFKVKNNSKTIREAEAFEAVCAKYFVACALNVFGKDRQTVNPLVAYRVRTSSVQKALDQCADVIKTLKAKGVQVIEENIHQEFVIWDTNPELDRGFTCPVVELA